MHQSTYLYNPHVLRIAEVTQSTSDTAVVEKGQSSAHSFAPCGELAGEFFLT